MKIALGTVQFGLKYGIANRSGRPSVGTAAAILDRALAAGVSLLDTAHAYGEAEDVLGTLGAGEQGWKIVTKLPALPEGIAATEVAGWCRRTLETSLTRLRTERVEGLLLHNPGDLEGVHGRRLADVLFEFRAQGLCSAAGVSIYGPDDLDRLESGPIPLSGLPLDIVQAPANVLDRRLETSGWADRLVACGTRIHLRSTFLQGLLLMPPSDLPARVPSGTAALRRWAAWLSDTGADPLSAALRFALSRPYAEHIVTGMDTLEQLDQILAAERQSGPIPPDDLAVTDAQLLDPRKWKSP